MTKADEAVALFQQGFTCSQAVLSVFAKDFGLDHLGTPDLAGIRRRDRLHG
jgi:hypothetical protein